LSSATPTTAANTVPTMNGAPIAGFALNNTNTNPLTGTVTNSQSSNFVQTGTSNYTFNPVTVGNPTTLANNHPTLALNGYVGGVMVTGTGGSLGAPTNFTKPYVITNFNNDPGNVSILLPGASSEMLATFNVGAKNAPAGAMTNSLYVFGSLNGNTGNVLNGARGTYVNPSNFAARDAAVSVNGVDIPVSLRTDGTSPLTPVGFANQQLVTASSVGANTAKFLTSISSTAVKPCACDSTQWGFWSASTGANNPNGQLAFEDQGVLLLWVAGVPTTAGALPKGGTATYTGHAIANIANGTAGLTYLAAGGFSNTVNFGTHTGAVSITGLDGASYAGTVALTPMATTFGTAAASPLLGSIGGRTAAINGSFFRGGPTNISPAYGEMGGSLILNGAGYLGSGIFAARR
jgi:hypothetical protein